MSERTPHSDRAERGDFFELLTQMEMGDPARLRYDRRSSQLAGRWARRMGLAIAIGGVVLVVLIVVLLLLAS